jgi:plastocyanin
MHNPAGYQSLGESRTRIGKPGAPKPCAPLLAVAAAGAVLLLAGAQRAPHLVTQKGRAFNPGVLTIQQGDTLEIVNDDGELIHHAYVASDTFSFDSGDQEPGSKTDVVFSVRGHFTVLCGIHPKMHLSVDVQ